MKSHRGRILAVLLSATVLVGGANLAAYAANGQPLLLGKSNKATKATKLKNPKGTALSLKSKSGTAPLSVSSSTKVTQLNADLVDGLDGPALQNKTYVYDLSGTTASTQITFNLPGLPPGRYLASYNVTALATGSTAFACMFKAGSTAAVYLHVADVNTNWALSASGYVDTTTLTYTLTCLANDPGIDVPLNVAPPSKSQVVLTRVDDVTTTATTGN